VTETQARLIALARSVHDQLMATPNTDSTYLRLVRDRREAVMAAKAAGATLAAIGEGLGIARQTVGKIVKAAGS
jgi:hypothetical protein